MRTRLVMVQLSCLAAALATSWLVLGERAPASPTQPDVPARTLSRTAEASSASARSDETRLEAALARVRPTASEARLLATPDVNEWERKLKLGTVASLHTKELSDGDRLGGLYVARMKTDPVAAIAAIESLLPKLSVDAFPIDRASLLDVAGDLPGQKDRARALAMSELTSSCPSSPTLATPTQEGTADVDSASGDARQLPCVVAHSVLVRVSSGAEEALQVTLYAIEHQADAALRATFASQLLRVYPELLARLQADPRTRDLPLEIPADEP